MAAPHFEPHATGDASGSSSAFFVTFQDGSDMAATLMVLGYLWPNGSLESGPANLGEGGWLADVEDPVPRRVRGEVDVGVVERCPGLDHCDLLVERERVEQRASEDADRTGGPACPRGGRIIA